MNLTDPSGMLPTWDENWGISAEFEGPGFYLNGFRVDQRTAQQTLGNGWGAACPYGHCDGLQLQAGASGNTDFFRKVNWPGLNLNCPTDGSLTDCRWSSSSLFFVADALFPGWSRDDSQIMAIFGEAGRMADQELKKDVVQMVVGDVLGAAGGAAADLARGPWESALFGRAGGFLNSWDKLRVGFGWNEDIGQNVFRITGKWVNGRHLLDWPWPW